MADIHQGVVRNSWQPHYGASEAA